MKLDLTRWGPATVLVVVVVAVVVIAGAVVTIVNPATLPFDQYLQTLAGAAGAGGLLGIGRGLMLKPATPTTNVIKAFTDSANVGGFALASGGPQSSSTVGDAAGELDGEEAEGSALDSPGADDVFADVEPDDPDQAVNDEGDWEAHTDPEVTSA